MKDGLNLNHVIKTTVYLLDPVGQKNYPKLHYSTTVYSLDPVEQKSYRN